MDELLRKAEDLGQSLAQHPRFKELIDARDAVREDADARTLMQDYEEQVRKIQKLTEAKQPIEVEDKHKLGELEQAISSNEKVKRLTQAQVNFSEMMGRVNRAIYEKIAPAEKPPQKPASEEAS